MVWVGNMTPVYIVGLLVGQNSECFHFKRGTVRMIHNLEYCHQQSSRKIRYLPLTKRPQCMNSVTQQEFTKHELNMMGLGKSNSPEIWQFQVSIGCGPPTQDSSHHQNDITFLVGDPCKPFFATGILGGVSLNAWHLSAARKVLFELPSTLQKCLDRKAYGEAVEAYCHLAWGQSSEEQMRYFCTKARRNLIS